MEGSNKKQLVLVSWESLLSTNIYIDETIKLFELQHIARLAFEELQATTLSFYILPNGEFWDNKRILITTISLLFQYIDSQQASPLTIYVVGSPLGTDRTWQSSSAVLRYLELQDKQCSHLNAGCLPSPISHLSESELSTSKNMTPVGSEESQATATPVPVPVIVPVTSESHFQQEVLHRDCGFCVFCGCAEQVRAVRLIGRSHHQSSSSWFSRGFSASELKSLGLTSVHDVRNGISLCRQCSQLYTCHWVTILPETCSLLVADDLRSHGAVWSQWRWLAGTSLRVPVDPLAFSQWPALELFERAFDMDTEFSDCYYAAAPAAHVSWHDSCGCLPQTGAAAAAAGVWLYLSSSLALCRVTPALIYPELI